METRTGICFPEGINLTDFTFIFWELRRRSPLGIYGGYPCIGYPQADKLVPAFRKVGANIQIFEFCDYANMGLTEKQDQKEPFKRIGPKIKSNKVLIEWDGITSRRDYQNIFKWNKEIYVIPHDGKKIGGGSQSPEGEKRVRKEVTKNCTKIIFQLQYERNLWKKLECNKFVTVYPPTRIGRQFDKIESRKFLGIRTKYAIIAWGNYWGKNYEDIIPWIAEWKDTSLLFVGSGYFKGMMEIAKKYNISKNIFSSIPGISDVDADLWFSASDLCAYPRLVEGTSTPTHVIGQGKCFVTRPFPMNMELEKLSGVVTSTNIKKITRELLLNEKRRKVLEAKSIKYAQENSYEKYAIKIGKLMGLSYSEQRKS